MAYWDSWIGPLNPDLVDKERSKDLSKVPSELCLTINKSHASKGSSGVPGTESRGKGAGGTLGLVSQLLSLLGSQGIQEGVPHDLRHF